MRTSSALDRLQAVPLFAGCTKKELQALDSACTEVKHPAGKVLCKEGDAGRELMIIVEGKAHVEREGQHVATLGPGEFLGELSLLDHGPRSATVTADSDVCLLVLTPSELASVLSQVQPLALRMLATLAARLRSADTVAYHH
ncbi:MAG TPA: cyclic nucleotide-binding domain-containing protein [Mycobacteriales bacterium]|nr:cyclic nucleotide-binding domain-containing protein [Mycobacteriales bacterium]